MSRLAPVVLEGRYVRLEPLGRHHVGPLLAVATGSRETFAHTFVPDSEAAMTAYVETALAAQAAGAALPFAVVQPATGAVKGSTRFGNVEFWAWPAGSPHQRGEHVPDVVEIGWTWYAPDVQRTGLNTEAKLLLLTHAFETWRVHGVRLMTDARNERSRQAILRLGASFDGVLRAHRIGADGAIRDTAAYSIVEAEWPAIKARLRALLR
jgi:RimJ/RimL family protein N-acetyltransferase